MTLQDYLTAVQRLLHDSSYRFWDQSELISYINSGRKMVAAETACTRTILSLDITAATSLAQATYSLDTISLTRRVNDILDVLLKYSTNTTHPLLYLPFSIAVRTPLWRYQSAGTPTHYTVNNRQLIVLQWPGVDYLGSSVDCLLEPIDLVNLADVDADLASPYTECPAFYAAYLAKLKDQRRTEANDFLMDYLRRRNQASYAQTSRRLVNR